VQPNRLSLPCMHSSLVHYCYLFKPLVNYLIDYIVAKSSHILYILFWDDWDTWVKYLCYGVMGKTSYITPICTLILKSTPSVLIILIRVIRVVYCKVCKNSSVRGMQIPYDVLFWMVG
jgi:hypothetical protein